MAVLELTLPDETQLWLDTQVQSGLYLDRSDVVRDLIRHEMTRCAKIAKADGDVDA